MRAARANAFTLIELVLVLLIMSIALAAVAPTLSGWNRSSKLRDAAEQFAASAGWARSQSATDGVVYRLQIDPAAGNYTVQMQQDKDFAAVSGDFGRTTTLPDGFKFVLPRNDNTAIDFYPNGRVTPALVRIESDQGDSIEITNDNPAQPLRVVAQ